MRKLTVALVLAACAAGTSAAPAVATAPQLPQAAGCSGVWVIVDYGSLGGGVSTRCATSYGTGLAALRSAGFSPTVDEGFVLKLSGKPSKPDINKAYWSYWHASKQADGSYSAWSYSNLGAGSYRPKQGNAEGWHYVSINGGNTPPGAKPPTGSIDSPKPKPSASTRKPTPKPSKKTSQPAKPASTPAKPSASSRTSKASASATASRPPAASTAATATASAAASTAPVTPTIEASGADPTETGAVVAQEQPSATPDAGGAGSPVGTIVVGAVIVAAAGGLGGWWLLKGRKS
ncbi:MAG: hypothetical protein QM582_13945 [Micropruina sp.]|uniref:hypothetical protein n=1 Tax=Micropruina sp. TaxID=2737536 RepID=UPI0039E49EA8